MEISAKWLATLLQEAWRDGYQEGMEVELGIKKRGPGRPPKKKEAEEINQAGSAGI